MRSNSCKLKISKIGNLLNLKKSKTILILRMWYIYIYIFVLIHKFKVGHCLVYNHTVCCISNIIIVSIFYAVISPDKENGDITRKDNSACEVFCSVLFCCYSRRACCLLLCGKYCCTQLLLEMIINWLP